MRAGGAVIAHVPVCYKLYERAQDWLHAAKPSGQPHTLHLQSSKYAVSKKRISPRLGLLSHHGHFNTNWTKGFKERQRLTFTSGRMSSAQVTVCFVFYPIMIWKLWNEAREDVECWQKRTAAKRPVPLSACTRK